MKILENKKLENLLMTNWSQFLDKNLLLCQVLADARNSTYDVSKQKGTQGVQAKVTITKFEIRNNSYFEIWTEFTVPASNGMIVGSHIYTMTLDGIFCLKETFGHGFEFET